MERLWYFDQITGYRRAEGRFWFYSKDGLWWNGKSLNFDHTDPSFHVRDKNNRRLYHRDLVSIKSEGIYKLIRVNDTWEFVDPQNNQRLSADRLEKRSVEFVAVGGTNLEFDRILIAQLKPISEKVLKTKTN